MIWWTLSKGEFGNGHGNALFALVLAWAQHWKMIFNSAQSKFLVISHLCSEPLLDLRLDGVLVGNLIVNVGVAMGAGLA